MNKNILRNLSYGVYVVSTLNAGESTGCIANSVMQITHNTIAISINHENFTNICIKNSKKFALSILSEQCNPVLIGNFGFKSGRNFNKFSVTEFIKINGIKIIKNSCGYIICNVINSLETETHTVFIGEIEDGDIINSENPMTYAYYHKVLKGASPKAAPTFIEETSDNLLIRYRCKVCGYIYEGDITKESEDYVCPICGQPKSVFEKI